MLNHLQIHTPLLFVIVLFPLSTALALFSISTLPMSATWPRTLADLAQVGSSLNTYAQSGPLETLHVLAVLSVSAVWKHAWSIPGSVLWVSKHQFFKLMTFQLIFAS